MDDLDPFTRDVLWLVAHGGPYLSAVILTDDLVNNGRLKPGSLDGSGGWFLVQDALAALNALDLVVYSVADYGVFTRVRCTPGGYALAGMPHAVREVGAKRSRGGNESDHPGDGTDWRNHSRYARGVGEIERMPLRDHIGMYWEHAHLHFEALWEIEDHERQRGEETRRQDAEADRAHRAGHDDVRHRPHRGRGVGATA